MVGAACVQVKSRMARRSFAGGRVKLLLIVMLHTVTYVTAGSKPGFGQSAVHALAIVELIRMVQRSSPINQSGYRVVPKSIDMTKPVTGIWSAQSHWLLWLISLKSAIILRCQHAGKSRLVRVGLFVGLEAKP